MNNTEKTQGKHRYLHDWNDDVFLLHVEVEKVSHENVKLHIVRCISTPAGETHSREERLLTKEERFIVTRTSLGEMSISFEVEPGAGVKIFQVLDRAYFPTESDCLASLFSSGVYGQ